MALPAGPALAEATAFGAVFVFASKVIVRSTVFAPSRTSISFSTTLLRAGRKALSLGG